MGQRLHGAALARLARVAVSLLVIVLLLVLASALPAAASASATADLLADAEHFAYGFNTTPDYRRAAGLYAQAAALGAPEALFVKGVIASNGLFGEPPDDGVAVAHWAAAAAAGHAGAAMALGCVYIDHAVRSRTL